MRYPLNRPRVRVGFGFGSAWFNTGKLHTGEDDQASAGEPVYAPAAGVVYNHTDDPKWGHGVIVDFDGVDAGATIWHVDHLLPDGTHVEEGEQIATVFDLLGNTHIHLSFWQGKYDENLRAGALFPAIWPDRFVEPDHYLDSRPDTPGLPDTGRPPTTTPPEEETVFAAVHRWSDGHLEKFRINAGVLQHTWEDDATQQWVHWQDLVGDGATDHNVFSIDGVVEDEVSDGQGGRVVTLEVHVTKFSQAGASWHYRLQPGSTWSGWPIGDAA